MKYHRLKIILFNQTLYQCTFTNYIKLLNDLTRFDHSRLELTLSFGRIFFKSNLFSFSYHLLFALGWTPSITHPSHIAVVCGWSQQQLWNFSAIFLTFKQMIIVTITGNNKPHDWRWDLGHAEPTHEAHNLNG